MPSVTANNVDLVDAFAVHQGSTYVRGFTNVLGGANLTGSTAKMQVRTEGPDGTEILELTSPVSAGKGITLGATGELDLLVPAAESWVPPGEPLLRAEARYVYEILVTTGTQVDSVAKGQIAVIPGVTRPPP